MNADRKSYICAALAVVMAGSIFAADASAQRGRRGQAPAPPPATQDAKYVGDATWAKLPEPRPWGSTSAVYPARDGINIWVAERCGANLCIGRDDVHPVLLFDPTGTLLRSSSSTLRAARPPATGAVPKLMNPPALAHWILT